MTFESIMWPKDEFVKCFGFPNGLYPYIKQAIINAQVIWVDDSTKIIGTICTGQFIWETCIWELEECSEIITSISYRYGSLDNPNLTAMILRG